MLQFISDNSKVINALTNIAMVVVWVTYLQLFLMSYIRQRRSNILINRGAGRGIDARCLISNMSAEPIYVQSLMAVLKKGSRELTASVTDIEMLGHDEEDGQGLREFSNQGPLNAGAYMDIGSFKALADTAGRQADEDKRGLEQEFETLEIIVVAAYASEEKSVAARRSFSLEGDGRLKPDTVSTRQVRFGTERSRILHHHSRNL